MLHHYWCMKLQCRAVHPHVLCDYREGKEGCMKPKGDLWQCMASVVMSCVVALLPLTCLLAYRRMVVVAWKPDAQSSGKGVAANHGSGVHPCLLLAVAQQHQHRQKGLCPNLLDSSGIWPPLRAGGSDLCSAKGTQELRSPQTWAQSVLPSMSRQEYIDFGDCPSEELNSASWQ